MESEQLITKITQTLKRPDGSEVLMNPLMIFIKIIKLR